MYTNYPTHWIHQNKINLGYVEVAITFPPNWVKAYRSISFISVFSYVWRHVKFVYLLLIKVVNGGRGNASSGVPSIFTLIYHSLIFLFRLLSTSYVQSFLTLNLIVLYSSSLRVKSKALIRRGTILSIIRRRLLCSIDRREWLVNIKSVLLNSFSFLHSQIRHTKYSKKREIQNKNL